MGQRLDALGHARRIEIAPAHQSYGPEVRAQLRIVGEAHEVDVVPAVGEVVEVLGEAEQAGVDDAPRPPAQAADHCRKP